MGNMGLRDTELNFAKVFCRSSCVRISVFFFTPKTCTKTVDILHIREDPARHETVAYRFELCSSYRLTSFFSPFIYFLGYSKWTFILHKAGWDFVA